MEKQNRKRGIQLHFRVTKEEKDLIYQKMESMNTGNFAAYVRKMAIDGYIIEVDYSDLKELCAKMQEINRSIKLIERQVNTTSRLYEQDFIEMKKQIGEIWRLLRLSFGRYRRMEKSAKRVRDRKKKVELDRSIT